MVLYSTLYFSSKQSHSIWKITARADMKAIDLSATLLEKQPNQEPHSS